MSSVAGSTLSREVTESEAESSAVASLNTPYRVVVWNDPVNLMSYVSWVFRSYFGHSKNKARELMLQVHHQGRAVVATGPLERVEQDVSAMHHYGLHATVEEAE